jgi:hypothetical protein
MEDDTPTQPPAATPPHPALHASDIDAIHQAIDAGDAARQAAVDLITHAEELISSMQQLSQDPPFAFVAPSSDQGPSLISPQTKSQISSQTESQTNALTENKNAENFDHTPDPFQVRQVHCHHTRVRRATEAEAKVRCSQRLTTKQEARFVGMLKQAVKKKATSFDLSAASSSLTAALNDAGLIETPDLPATDVDAIHAVD